MNRAARRAVDARADRAFAKARGTLLEANFARDWAMLDEATGAVHRIPARELPMVLGTFGLCDLYEEVERQRGEHSTCWIPCLVVVSAWATVRWCEALPMVRGGAA